MLFKLQMYNGNNILQRFQMCACRPTSDGAVFVNTGKNPLERLPRRASHLQAQVLLETIGHNTYTNTNTDGAVLRSKLVDGRCRVQIPVVQVYLAYWTFPWFSLKLAQIRVRIPQKDPYGGQAPYRSRSHKRTIGLQPTTERLGRQA